MAFRRFGGHDHRVNVGNNYRFTPVMQEFRNEPNSSPLYVQTPSNFHPSFNCGNAQSGFVTTAPATFQSSMYHTPHPQTGYNYQPSGDSFSFMPSFPANGINYWGGVANTSLQNGGFPRPANSVYGGHGIQPPQATFNNWQH
ncbi:ATP-dependent RNA helicase An3 [Dirofilaria immitis]|nr:ATP-dependent RNA helicase An3 [Dirofilaria immitis]